MYAVYMLVPDLLQKNVEASGVSWNNVPYIVKVLEWAWRHILKGNVNEHVFISSQDTSTVKKHTTHSHFKETFRETMCFCYSSIYNKNFSNV